MPVSRASTTSGRVAWFSMPATPSTVSDESPITVPFGAMNVTRVPISSPIRLASSSRAATVVSGAARESRSAVRRASATSVFSMRSFNCRRVVVANISPATASASTAAPSAATKNFVWNVVMRRAAGRRVYTRIASP